jgi:hypothetical protein
VDPGRPVNFSENTSVVNIGAAGPILNPFVTEAGVGTGVAGVTITLGTGVGVTTVGFVSEICLVNVFSANKAIGMATRAANLLIYRLFFFLKAIPIFFSFSLPLAYL